MLAYYISQSNNFVFRTEPTSSNEFTMSLQNMTTLVDTTGSISNLTYTAYESFVSFSLDISGSTIGEQYRATLITNSAAAIPKDTFTFLVKK